MDTLKVGDTVLINNIQETGIIICVPDEPMNLYKVDIKGDEKLYWIEEMTLVKEASGESDIGQSSAIGIMEELVEASEHIQKVFYSMANRGAYPGELLPDDPRFMGKQGFQFLIDATKKVIKYIEDNKG